MTSSCSTIQSTLRCVDRDVIIRIQNGQRRARRLRDPRSLDCGLVRAGGRLRAAADGARHGRIGRPPTVGPHAYRLLQASRAAPFRRFSCAARTRTPRSTIRAGAYDSGTNEPLPTLIWCCPRRGARRRYEPEATRWSRHARSVRNKTGTRWLCADKLVLCTRCYGKTKARAEHYEHREGALRSCRRRRP